MLRTAIVGLGKMGLSHYAILNTHPGVQVDAVCDTAGYLLSVVAKYTGVRPFSDFRKMLKTLRLDAVVIATPTSTHYQLVRSALDHGLHVFCEKPLSLSPKESEELVTLAEARKLVAQVGYHNRFVATFRELKRLLVARAIGDITHVLAEAYGPVILHPSTTTWRSRRSEGGGCLLDYAAHPINLLTWYLGTPVAAGGTALKSVFSSDTDDAVAATLLFHGGESAQLCVNWSDESSRKMTTRITIWGTAGRLFADRQECQAFLRSRATAPAGYRDGWNVRFITDLTDQVWFYLRGEEYSAQIDYFVRRIEGRQEDENINSFASAFATDRAISMIIEDASRRPHG